MKILNTVLSVALLGAAAGVSAQDQSNTTGPNPQHAMLVPCAVASDNGGNEVVVCPLPHENGGASTVGDGAPTSGGASALAANPGDALTSEGQTPGRTDTSSSPQGCGGPSMQSRQGDPDAPQNHIEYGGGG